MRPLFALPGLFLSLTILFALDATSHLEIARRLLNTGHIEEAERFIRRHLRDVAADAPLQATLGDVLFRRADFTGAALAWQAALDIDPKCARAYWGQGRMELAQFHRMRARALISKAFSLDPRDPDIILAYAEFTADPASRVTLLRNVVFLTQHSDPRRAEESMAQLEVEQHLNGSRQGQLESVYKACSIRLTAFQPVSPRPAGLLVPVQINGGRVLHLLLDTGARGITVAARTARRLGLEPVSESSIGGLGGSPVSASIMLAKNVAIGDLRLSNCLVEVTRDPLIRGADGVIGMNLFEAFEIRMDALEKVLQLTPFGTQLPAPGSGGAALSPWIAYDRREAGNPELSTPAYGFRHFLLVKTTVENREGLFLLDTGSAVTSLAREFASPGLRTLDGPPLHGAAGLVADAFRISPVTLQIAGKNYLDNEAISLDLSGFSQQQGVRVSGILGFSALSHQPVTINYRDGLVDIGKR